MKNRPQKQKKKEVYNFSLYPDIHARIRQHAMEEEISMSHLITEWAKKNTKPLLREENSEYKAT